MSLSKISKALGAAVVMSAVSFSAFAAEDAAGVKEHLGLTLKTAQAAQAAAAAGDKNQCVVEIKACIQHYKQLTGDVNGKPMQDAVKQLKEGKEECQQGNTTKASTTLAEAVGKLQNIVNTAAK